MTNLEEKQTADFIKELEERILRSRQGLFNFTIGLIEQKSIKKYKRLIEKLQPKDRSTATKAKKILVSASNKFQKSFRKLVWNYRCEKRVEIDKIKGINSKDKKGKFLSKPKRKNTMKGEGKENGGETRAQNEEINYPISESANRSGTLEKIYNWIRGGIRWLGL